VKRLMSSSSPRFMILMRVSISGHLSPNFHHGSKPSEQLNALVSRATPTRSKLGGFLGEILLRDDDCACWEELVDVQIQV
jgi:hypothetical protein